MAIKYDSGFPISVHINSASSHETKLVQKTIDNRFLDERPRRLIGDKAYDSDPLDRKLKRQRIELIAPHKNNSINSPT